MSVAAIIVTFFPEQNGLQVLLDRLRQQVDWLIVVDNGSVGNVAQGEHHFIGLEENKGIAFAHNTGIELAKKMGARFVLLFDQDSVPEIDMVSRLVFAYERLLVLGMRVAAVGPRYHDERQNNPPPFVRIKSFGLERCKEPDFEEFAKVDYLISSGCLIPVGVIEDVGGMLNELFIDYVDIEWGLRARSKGYQSFGCFSAKMKHSLGENPIIFLGKNIPMHSALRHYYHVRNAVWLYRQSWLSWNWKFVDGYRMVVKVVFYSLFAKPRSQQLLMMVRGVRDGFANRLGKYALAR